MKALRLGIKLRNAHDVDGAEIQATATAAERMGLDSLWIDAHVAVPAHINSRFGLNASGKPPFGYRDPFADPFITLAFAAAATTRIRIGTAVIPYMSTHALNLAKQVATIDRLSRGRFELGLGAGWLAEEGAVLGHAVDHPTARMAEAIDLLRVAWRSGEVEWCGKYHTVPLVGIEPRPAQGDHLPIWLGGAGPAALRVAVNKQAGILLSNPGVDAIKHARTAFQRTATPARIGALIGLAAPDLPSRLCALHAAGLELAILTSPLATTPLVAQLTAVVAEVAALQQSVAEAAVS